MTVSKPVDAMPIETLISDMSFGRHAPRRRTAAASGLENGRICDTGTWRTIAGMGRSHGPPERRQPGAGEIYRSSFCRVHGTVNDVNEHSYVDLRDAPSLR